MGNQSKPSKRSDKSTVSARLLEVYKLKLAGKTRAFILEHASNSWGISDHRTDQLIAEATKLILEQNAATMEEDRATIVTNLWDIYGNVKGSDPRLAVTIQESIAKLKGAHKVAPQEHILEIKRELKDKSDDDLDSLLGLGKDE